MPCHRGSFPCDIGGDAVKDRPFQVGDRVAVYGITYRDKNGVWLGVERVTGTIKQYGEQWMIFESEKYKDIAVHPKQCRLLKKKERRRVWMHGLEWLAHAKGIKSLEVFTSPEHVVNPIEFIEVKK